MSGSVDYAAVEVPDDKSPAEYSWQQRRAEILQKIEDAGPPPACFCD